MTRAVLALAALTTVLLGGCGSEERGIGTGGFVEGGTLTVYVSLPRASSPGAADMVDGAKLALWRSGGRRGAYNVNAVFVDSSPTGPDASSAGPGATDPVRALANARAALRDAQTIAYIGDVDSRSVTQSLPLLNAGGILQISPGAEYAGLTTAAGAVERGEPERFLPAGDPSYVRLVPSDVARVDRYVDATRGARRVVVEADATEAGRSLQAALAGALGSRASSDPSSADAVIFAGEDVDTARSVFESAPPDAVLVGGDAIGRSGVASELDRRVARRLRIVTAAPEVDARFAREFEERFGRRPSGYAVIGAEAMNVALSAVERAGNSAGLRQRVIDAARSTSLPSSPLGPLRIDPATGDPSGVRVRDVPATSTAVSAER